MAFVAAWVASDWEEGRRRRRRRRRRMRRMRKRRGWDDVVFRGADGGSGSKIDVWFGLLCRRSPGEGVTVARAAMSMDA
jgi:hypothetical protein